MKCPNCDSEKITAMKALPLARGADTFSMECTDCLRKWHARRGHRRRSEESRADWNNVEFLETLFEREMRVGHEKVDRGECPRCGGIIVVTQDRHGSSVGRDGQEPLMRVKYEMNCGSCEWRTLGVSDLDHLEKKKLRMVHGSTNSSS